MKTLSFAIPATIAIALYAFQPAQAYTIDGGTEVGAIDPWIELADLPNAGETTEGDYVALALAGLGYENVLFEIKEETLSLTQADGFPNIVVADVPLPSPPPANLIDEYFLLKNSTTWALHQNLSEIAYAVIDTSDTNLYNTTTYTYVDNVLTETGESTDTQTYSDWMNIASNTTTVSHISLFTGTFDEPEDPPNGAPTPTPLMLMGLGLVGMIGARRFMR